MCVHTAKKYHGSKETKINSFIDQFIGNIKFCNRKYNRIFKKKFKYNNYNFIYGESQIYSLIHAAIHKLTPVHQSECGIARRRDRRNPIDRGKNKTGNGRADLWAYMDGIEYFLELKRSYISWDTVLNEGQIPLRVSGPWVHLVRQTDGVSRELRDEVKKGQRYKKSTCSVGLQIVTPYMSDQDEYKLIKHKQPIDGRKISRKIYRIISNGKSFENPPQRGVVV